MKIRKIIMVMSAFTMFASFGASECRDKLAEALKLDKEGRVDEAIRELACVVPQDRNSEAFKDKDVAEAALSMAKLYLKKIYSGASKDKVMLKEKFAENILKASVCNDFEIKGNVQEVIDAFGRKEYETLRNELERKVNVEARIRDESVKRGLDSREAELKRAKDRFEKEKAQVEAALTDREKALKKKEEALLKNERGLVAREEKFKQEKEELMKDNAHKEEVLNSREKALKNREAKLTSNGKGQAALNARLEELRSRIAKQDEAIKSYESRISALNDKLKDSLSDHLDNDNEYYMEPPEGMFRGLATTVFSPMNLLRSLVQIHREKDENLHDNLLFVPFYMVGDSFIVLHDVCAGTADLLTFGWFGNEWYKSGRTPWFWQRDNTTIGISK